MSDFSASLTPPDASKKRRKVLFSCVYWMMASLCWGAYVLGAWWLDRWAIGVDPEAYLSLRNLLSNSFVGLLVTVALTALTRRAVFSILVVSAIHALVCVASKLKLSILGDPLALQDFYFLTSMDRASLELFSLYVPRSGFAFLSALGVAALLVVLCVFERRRLNKSSRGMVAVRYLSGMVSLGLLVALYAAMQPWPSIYSESSVRPSPLNLTTAVLRSGLVGSIVYSHQRTSNMTFDVDEVALRRSIALLPAKAVQPVHGAPGGLLPHVIVILSESFIDPRILAGMEHAADSIPEVRRLMNGGGGGQMVVPTYGGGTVRTEFEVLTGMPVSAFPAAYYPYVSLSRKSIPGLASVLGGLGYGTVAIHGNSGAFWNRTNTYKSMGIDKFITSRKFREKGKRDGNWYSDRSMTDFILEEVESSDEPRFIAAISIENHGPYTLDPEQAGIADIDAWRAIDVPQGVTGVAELELRNYLYHLRNADAELARLIVRLERNKRPFVLAFFGDHLPALPQAYGALGFIDQQTPERQLVPWVIVRDQRLPPAEQLLPVHEAWQLPAELIFRAGLDGGRYFGFSRSIGRALGTDGVHDFELRAGLNAASNANLTRRLEEYVD